jgi:hypothetical protein
LTEKTQSNGDKKTQNRKPIGRRAWNPDPKERERAITMASLGIPIYQIALVFKKSEKTLRKYFRNEFLAAAVENNQKVLGSLFQMATEGKIASAAIFWARTRCGFKFDRSALADLAEPPPNAKTPPSAEKESSWAPPDLDPESLIFTDSEGNRVA